MLDREIDTGQQRRAVKILELAEGAVAGELGIALDAFRSDPPANAEAVVLSVAARAFENPLTLTSESAGPWSGSYRAGGFELTNYERQQLGSAGTAAAVFDVQVGADARYNVHPEDDLDVPSWIANG